MGNMQPDNSHVLTPEENRAVFLNRIAPQWFSRVAHLKTPELHVVGAQPGSGKSTLIKKSTSILKNDLGLMPSLL